MPRKKKSKTVNETLKTLSKPKKKSKIHKNDYKKAKDVEPLVLEPFIDYDKRIFNAGLYSKETLALFLFNECQMLLNRNICLNICQVIAMFG